MNPSANTKPKPAPYRSNSQMIASILDEMVIVSERIGVLEAKTQSLIELCEENLRGRRVGE